MVLLSIHVLGPFQVKLSEQPVTGFASDKVRALLAYLALVPDCPHRREMLAGLLWPDFPERSARTNLRNGLANLRQVIRDHETSPPFLHTTRQTIQFNSHSDYWLDADAFENLLAPVPSTSEQLEQAVSLVRGPFLEGFTLADAAPFEEWLLLQREHFCRELVEALDNLAAIYEACGACEQALVHAWHRVELEPWQEDGQRQLMRLLARAGQRGAALVQYESYRELLASELAAEPSGETRALHQAILSGELPPESALLGPPDPIWDLPASTTPFFGRSDELAALLAKLAEPATRLVTVTGLGGSGKTRLVLEMASLLVERERQARADGSPLTFPYGIVFVPLAALDSVEGLVPALADAVRLRLEGDREQLLEFLRRKQLLLILDNLEQLLAAVDFLAEILRIAPGVKILATSRERLQVQGEHVLSLGGLSYPDHDLKPSTPVAVDLDVYLATYPALQLLAECVRRVRPGFAVGSVDLAAVAELCRLVDGLPLALELAASWADALSLDDILVEAQRSLDFLQVDWPDLPQRQRSIRAVFDVSWLRLSSAEQTMFSSLTVFRGGFARESAAQVVVGAEALHCLLAALVRKSFLQYDQRGERYGIHELLRQYGAEKLAREPTRETEVRDRHSSHYARAVQHWEADLRASRQQATLIEMDVERDNIRTAWEWTIKRVQVGRLAQMVDGFQCFYWRRGRYQEGEAAFRRAATCLAAAHPSTAGRHSHVLARILAWQSSYCQALGYTERAAQLQSEAWVLVERQESWGQNTWPEKALLYWLMGRRLHVSDYDQARQFYLRSLDLYRKCEDSWSVANVLHSLSSIARVTGAMSKAWHLCEESLAIRRVLGDQTGIAKSTVYLAEIALHQGRYEESECLARDSITKCRRLGDQAERAYGLHILGVALESVGRFEEALCTQKQSLDAFEEMERPHYVAAAQSHLASTKMHLGQYEEARDHALACLALARETDLTFKITQAQRLLGLLALTGGEYAECRRRAQASLAISEQTGRSIETGLAHVLLAFAALGLGNPERAKRHLYAALQLALKNGTGFQFVWTLSAATVILADQDAPERAVAMYSSLLQHAYVATSRWFADVVGRPMTAVSTGLPPAIAARAEERGRSCDLEATAAELLAELDRQLVCE